MYKNGELLKSVTKSIKKSFEKKHVEGPRQKLSEKQKEEKVKEGIRLISKSF